MKFRFEHVKEYEDWRKKSKGKPGSKVVKRAFRLVIKDAIRRQRIEGRKKKGLSRMMKRKSV